MQRKLSFVFALLSLLSVSLPALLAQSDNAALSGSVADSSGALLPNAKVTVRNSATKANLVVTTNSSGNFTVPNVTPGNYTVRVEAPGFETTTLDNVLVDPAIGRRVDITMKVGDPGVSITVEAGVNNVQTESAVVGQLVTQEQVKSIQLNGRNPLYLSQLEPGVVRNSPMASFAFGLDNGINIGGSRNQESLITLDGAPSVRTRSNGTSVGVADVDSTSQVQILTNSYAAEYGRSSGGQIRIVPKSGTSTFHGSVFEYFRNTALNANTWQRKLPSNTLAVRSKPPGFRFNQYGWNLNGPVFIPRVFNPSRTKLFFLAGQEYIKYNNDDTVFRRVPTVAMRAGDFSELLSPNIFYGGSTILYRPYNAGDKTATANRVAYPNNVIPATDLSANGLALLNAFPAPNAAGSTYNWVDSAAERQTQRKDTIVVDYVPADAHRLRFTLLNYNYYDYSPHYGNFNRNPRIFTRPNQIGVLHYAWTISPTTVNEAIISAASDHVTIGIDQSSGLFDRTKYGISYPYLYSASTKTIPNKIPTVSLPNFDLLDGGPYPSRSGGIVYSAADNLTKVIGNHTFKAGFNFEYSGENNFDQITVSNTPGSTNNQNGRFNFTDVRSGGVTTNIGIGNAAEGLFDTYGEIGQRSYTLYRATAYEGFLQDQWRVTPKLVIEAGARYSWYNPYYAKWGNQSVFDPAFYNPANAVTVDPKTDVVTGGDRYNGVVIPGSGFPSIAQGHVDPAILNNPIYQALFRGFGRSYSPTVATDIQPRFGITYLVRPGTVVRGGGGRYVQRLGITDNVFTGGNAPFQPSSTVSLGQANSPGGVGSNNFPFNYSSQALIYPSPEAYNWNVTVEQEFNGLGAFTLAYAGRRGIHLEELLNVNQLQPNTVYLPQNVGVVPDALRPYQGFSNINTATNGGASSYHSLQANLRRRLSKGLLFGAAYTWSKSMDFGSSNGTNLPNAYDKSIFYGPSDFDRRHVFVSNIVYNIDQFDHSSHIVNRNLLGNWQVSGTLQGQTGAPLSVSTGTDFAGVGPGSGSQLVPFLKKSQTTKTFAGQTSTATWFDITAFPTLNGARSNTALTTLYQGQFAGRGTRNQIWGPGFQSYNMALNKTMHVIPGHDNHTLVFRAEAFNLANHPTADNPDTGYTSGTFGQSKTKGGTYGADRQFQFSLRYAF